MLSRARYFMYVLAFLAGIQFPISLSAQAGKPGDPAVVAKYQGVEITQGDLNKYATKDLEGLELERVQFEMKYARDKSQIFQANLARLLEDRLLQTEATRRGISREQLLETELQGKVKVPTDDDVKTFYEANRQRINQPLPQIDSQIRNYLKTQYYEAAKVELIEQLKKSYGVMVYLQPLRSNLDIEGYPSKGPPDAPVVLVEFSDFQCPYCASLHATLEQVIARYSAQVRLIYRNFPLSQIHPNAEKAAEAGLCAADQGHFWEMHDLMFQSQSLLKEADLKSKAAQLNLDTAMFNSCLNSGQKAGKVQQDLYAGAKLGVAGTPALFVNGRFVSGAVPLADIVRIIDDELKSPSQSVKRISSPDK